MTENEVYPAVLKKLVAVAGLDTENIQGVFTADLDSNASITSAGGISGDDYDCTTRTWYSCTQTGETMLTKTYVAASTGKIILSAVTPVFDEKDTVVGVRYGEGAVNVSLDRGRDSYSATGKFYVTNEKGIYISAAEKNGNELKLTFCANKDYAGGDSIRVYVFGKTDGMLRSIKKAYTVSAPALSGGGEAELSQTVEAETGDTVGIFLFDASNDKLSQYQQILR